MLSFPVAYGMGQRAAEDLSLEKETESKANSFLSWILVGQSAGVLQGLGMCNAEPVWETGMRGGESWPSSWLPPVLRKDASPKPASG